MNNLPPRLDLEPIKRALEAHTAAYKKHLTDMLRLTMPMSLKWRVKRFCEDMQSNVFWWMK